MLAPGFEPGAKPIPGCGGWAAVGVKDGVPEGWTSGEEEDEAAGLRASIFTAEDLFVTGVATVVVGVGVRVGVDAVVGVPVETGFSCGVRIEAVATDRGSGRTVVDSGAGACGEIEFGCCALA